MLAAQHARADNYLIPSLWTNNPALSTCGRPAAAVPRAAVVFAHPGRRPAKAETPNIPRLTLSPGFSTAAKLSSAGRAG